MNVMAMPIQLPGTCTVSGDITAHATSDPIFVMKIRTSQHFFRCQACLLLYLFVIVTTELLLASSFQFARFNLAKRVLPSRQLTAIQSSQNDYFNQQNVSFSRVPKCNTTNCTEKSTWSTRRILFNTAATLAVMGALLPCETYSVASAAPPFAVIAEELGYFPVQNPKTGQLTYIPQRVKRESSKQAMELVTKLNEQGVVLAGTYWCPHTTRQKELLGREAFNEIKYLECSSQGYKGKPEVCQAQKVDGYPTWLFPGGQQISGERPLSVIAQAVGMTNFKEELEENLPASLGSESCK